MPSDKLIRRFNFRIYPTAAQEQQAAVTQDACRFVWNTLLTYRSLQYRICGRSVSKADCDRYITTLRAVFPWLKAADSMALQETSKDLDTAFRNFFEGRAGYPVYKSAKRQADGSCRCAWNRISCQRYSRMPVGLLALTSASSQACHICGIWAPWGTRAPGSKPKRLRTPCKTKAGHGFSDSLQWWLKQESHDFSRGSVKSLKKGAVGRGSFSLHSGEPQQFVQPESVLFSHLIPELPVMER